MNAKKILASMVLLLLSAMTAAAYSYDNSYGYSYDWYNSQYKPQTYYGSAGSLPSNNYYQNDYYGGYNTNSYNPYYNGYYDKNYGPSYSWPSTSYYGYTSTNTYSERVQYTVDYRRDVITSQTYVPIHNCRYRYC